MTRAEKIWLFIEQCGTATVTDIRAEFGLRAEDASCTVRNLHSQGCLVRKPDKFNHGKRFVYETTNHPPPGAGRASLAMRPIIVAPEKLPLINLGD